MARRERAVYKQAQGLRMVARIGKKKSPSPVPLLRACFRWRLYHAAGTAARRAQGGRNGERNIVARTGSHDGSSPSARCDAGARHA